MADPLSIAASIAGVISLADIVFIRTRKYLASVKTAEKDVKHLSQEVLLLTGALHSLSKLAQALDRDGLTNQHMDNLRMHHIAACHATLDEVGKKLKKFEDCGTMKKLTWPFASDRTKDLLAEIARHKENVNLALTADSMGTLLQVLSKTEEARGNTEKLLEEAKKTREIASRIRQDSDRRDIVNYFLPYNPQQNYEMSLSLRHPRTGLWLTRRPEFQTWLQRPDSALWLNGIPGAGKTVLAGTVIEESLKRSSEDIATSFFFCDYKDEQTQSPQNVLSALASQLAIQKEEAYVCLARYYQELHPSRGLDRRPDICGLQDILKDMVKCFAHVYLIIDGLDECGDKTNIVIDAILEIVECSDNISTALLSRDECDIRDRLAADFMGVEIAAHKEDITEYVTSEIEKRISTKNLRIDDLSLKGDILERLVDGAKGMFRWVACQLDFLSDCLSDKECRDALRRLPPGLNESYARILQRVPAGKEHSVQMILNFIAYAEPRLDIQFLRNLISVPKKLNKNEMLDPRSIIREESIRRLCRSLIRRSNDGCHYEFAHFSVQEFLEGEMMSKDELKAFQVSKSICQLLLAKQCMRYLVFEDFSHVPPEDFELQDHLQLRIERYPVYFYAAVYWPIFALHHWADKTLMELATVLFQQKKTGNFISWALELTSFVAYRLRHYKSANTRHHISIHIKHPGIDETYMSGAFYLLPRLSTKTFTTLHMAAALCLPMVCSSLINQGADIDQRSSFGSPLQCAVQGLFLANPDVMNDDNPRTLAFPYDRYYYSYGEEDVSEFDTDNTVKLLVTSGASRVTACSNPFKGQTLITVALRVAGTMASFRAIATLIEADYDLKNDNLDQFSRFYSGTCGVKNLVLSLSPVIDTSIIHFNLCQKAWSRALRKDLEFTRHPGLVDMRISSSQDALTTIIITSVLQRDVPTLEKALEDPRISLRNLRDREDMPIFTRWLKSRMDIGCDPRTESLVIGALLRAGMEVNQTNEMGELPIHELAAEMSTGVGDVAIALSAAGDDVALCDIVNEFIGRGTGCDAQSEDGQNVFHLGLKSPSFINAVLKTEAEEVILTALKTRDKQGHTPITLALETGEEDIALLLLEKAQYNRETLSSPASAFAHCVMGGANRAFNMLLAKGFEVKPTEFNEKTLLHYIGPRTDEAFVSQLLGMFPDGLHCRIYGKIPLSTYLRSCIGSNNTTLNAKLEVVRLLTVSGSDELDQGERKGAWEDFVLFIQTRNDTNATMDCPTKAFNCLLELGFLESYEAVARVSGAFQLLKPLVAGDGGPWRISNEVICGVLEHTTLWEPLCGSASILRLLTLAVIYGLVDIVNVLLDHGVSVHHRIDNMSALEVACLRPAEGPSRKRIFTLLLDNAELSRLDEINPHRDQRRGLIHYLAGENKQWQLRELLKRGVDANLRADIHRHNRLWRITSMTDSRGMDTALAAAENGSVDVLMHLQTSSQGPQPNWKRRCDFSSRDKEGVRLHVSGANALHLAANYGNCDILRFYVDRCLLTDIDAVSTELFTPIHIASFWGEINTVRFLHSRGADISPKSADGSLPLHLAVRQGRAEVVKFLVEQGSTMDADIHGLTPIGYAMQRQKPSILDCFRTTKQYGDYISEPGKHKRDLICAYVQALVRGDVQQCEEVLRRGCQVDSDLPGQEGRSALVLAIEKSDSELVRWLLSRGVKATGRALTRDGFVTSPLQAMIMQPSLSDVLPRLLQRYQDEGGIVIAERPSLLCIAIKHDNTARLGILLDHIARNEYTNSDTDGDEKTVLSESPVNQAELDGETPLHLAAREGDCGALELLLQHGADADVFDDYHLTPLQRAIVSEPLEDYPAARLLLRHGATLEHRDQEGQTAISLASEHGGIELVRLLDDAGADVTTADFDSWTCLHYAADVGDLELFVWLVRRGLELRTKNSRGWSAIQYASWNMTFSSFLLGYDCAFDDNDAVTYASPGYQMDMDMACLNKHFSMYLRRLGPERLRIWANLEPRNSWSPLCMLASIGKTLAVTNILRLGADVDFEGSPHGSALIVACSSGQLESVKILVRHGSAISYLGTNGPRSAVEIARKHKLILAWLLVDRFTEQGRISNSAEASSSAHTTDIVEHRGGIVKAELVISGTAERQVHESARDYWIRLMAIKRGWRGKVVRQDEKVQTHRPSRLIPEETVRICPGYYGVADEEE